MHGSTSNLQEGSLNYEIIYTHYLHKQTREQEEEAAAEEEATRDTYTHISINRPTDRPERSSRCMAYLGPGAVLALVVVAALLLLLPLCLPPLPPPPPILLLVPVVLMLLLCFLALFTPYREFPKNFKPQQ